MTTTMAEPTCVSVHYMPSDGKRWAGYLCEKLRGEEYDIKCDLNDLTKEPKTAVHSSKAKVNVVFVTPDFLDVQYWDWSNNIDKNTCILVLTGTEHEDLQQSASNQKCGHVLDFYIYELKETETSVRDLLIFIISKYEDTTDIHYSHSAPKDLCYSGVDSTEQRLQKHAMDASKHEETFYRKHTPDTIYGDKHTARNVEGTDDDYDVLPTMPRQVNGIRDIIYKNGMVYILLWRRAESGLKVQLKDIEICPDSTECAVYELPYEGKDSANVSVTQDGAWLGARLITVDSTTDSGNTSEELCDHSTSHLPPANDQTTAKFYLSNSTCAQSADSNHVTVSVSTQTDPPEQNTEDGQTSIRDSATSRDSLYVNIDGIVREPITPTTPTPALHAGNKLEYIREILEEATDPEELLCRCLGIEKGIRQLDDKMTSMVQSIETLRHLSFSGKRVYEAEPEAESSTWPTLIHFGAQFDLVNFCDVLLTNPLMYGACVRPNKYGYMPHDVARLHGHTELASMLKHFSEFVKAEKERDSGISGISGTPRLSTIGLLEEQPPTAHTYSSQWGENYINMTPKECGQGDYENEQDIEKLRKHKPKQRDLSQDLSFAGSSEREDDNQSVSSAMSTPQTSPNPPFQNLANIDYISKFDPEKSTLIETEDVFEPEVEHHKDVQAQISPNNDKKTKTSKLKKFFFYKKHGKEARSNSEPLISPDMPNLRKNKRTKSYFRTSPRSSDTSSSTTSTYSNSSVTMRDEGHTEMQLREDTKQAGKNKVTGFIKNAKRRQSIRIKTALLDEQFAVPSLPSRGMISDDEV